MTSHFEYDSNNWHATSSMKSFFSKYRPRRIQASLQKHSYSSWGMIGYRDLNAGLLYFSFSTSSQYLPKSYRSMSSVYPSSFQKDLRSMVLPFTGRAELFAWSFVVGCWFGLALFASVLARLVGIVSAVGERLIVWYVFQLDEEWWRRSVIWLMTQKKCHATFKIIQVSTPMVSSFECSYPLPTSNTSQSREWKEACLLSAHWNVLFSRFCCWIMERVFYQIVSFVHLVDCCENYVMFQFEIKVDHGKKSKTNTK